MKFAQHQIEAFALRLADARAQAGLPRSAVVELVSGLSEPQQLYNYEKARRVPDRVEVVLDLEQALALERGTLCRLLGFAPLDSQTPNLTVSDVIAQDRQLTYEAKEQLLSAYRRLVRSAAPTHRPPT